VSAVGPKGTPIEFEVDKLIRDAEALAVKRGFNPTLAL
jgi:hypothetical protein